MEREQEIAISQVAGHIFAVSEPSLGNTVEGCMMNEEPLIGPIVRLWFFFIFLKNSHFRMQKTLLAIKSRYGTHVPSQNITMNFYSLNCWTDDSVPCVTNCRELFKFTPLKPKPWLLEVPYKEWQRWFYYPAFYSLFITLPRSLLSFSTVLESNDLSNIPQDDFWQTLPISDGAEFSFQGFKFRLHNNTCH